MTRTFNNKRDIAIINKLAQTHDGPWYSRVSRIGEAYQPDQWWLAEATTLSPERLRLLISQQARKHSVDAALHGYDSGASHLLV